MTVVPVSNVCIVNAGISIRRLELGVNATVPSISVPVGLDERVVFVPACSIFGDFLPIIRSAIFGDFELGIALVSWPRILGYGSSRHARSRRS